MQENKRTPRVAFSSHFCGP